MQPEVSHERAQPLGIDVRVTRSGCDTLMAQERLDIAQVGSALVEQEGGGRAARILVKNPETWRDAAFQAGSSCKISNETSVFDFCS